MKSTAKKTTLLVGTALISSLALAGAAKKVETDLEIRFLDFSKISESKGGQLVAKELQEKQEVLTKEIKQLEQEFSVAAKEFQAKAATLSEAGRERGQKKLVRLEREYKAKLQEAEEDLKIAMQTRQERLLRDCKEAVDQYAKANDVDLVFGPAGVIYASEKAGCTNDVVALMDKNHETKLAAAKKTKTTA